MDEKFIDIEKILQNKAPGLLKVLPRFALGFLKRKLREDDINQAMRALAKYEGLEFNHKTLEYLNIKVHATFLEKLPSEGAFIVVSNHPLGGLDGIALIKAVSEHRQEIRFVVNDILLHLKNFGNLFVGVNKLGTNAKSELMALQKIYEGNYAILIFPAGLVSRKQGKKIMDLEWNKSFVSQAMKYNLPVFPVFIEGRNSMFFYWFARLRKFLGIKANLEMMLLPDEMFKQRNSVIHILFGKKILPQVFSRNKSRQEWAQEVKNYVYSAEFRSGISFEEYLKRRQ